ncbi:hypothetical protein [Weissella cibaria]|uniref:hypothetical protein n=1 Tax=Weissella cibaria TaxID=137591 RepID=UPI000BFFD4D4|nr:hypothetical protein [Weissella cibaria]
MMRKLNTMMRFSLVISGLISLTGIWILSQIHFSNSKMPILILALGLILILEIPLALGIYGTWSLIKNLVYLSKAYAKYEDMKTEDYIQNAVNRFEVKITSIIQASTNNEKKRMYY